MQENNHQSSFLKNIFLSPDEPRLRAGWRLLLQTMLTVFLGVCVVAFLIFNGALKPDSDFSMLGMEVMLPLQIAEFVIMTGSIYLARRFFDKRSFASMGVKVDRMALLDTLAGIAIAFCIMGFIFMAEFTMGWVTFKGFSWQVEPLWHVIKSTLTFAFIFILTGWNEELLARGYHLQNLSEGMGRFWGVFISSAIFGIAHITNPNATWIAAFWIFIGGLFFAYAYLQTSQLWLPIGLHIGWNFSQGVIFGFPVSGLNIYPLTRVEFSGPTLWSGGAFGPEAGLILFPGLAIGFIFVYFYTIRLRRNHEQ